MMKNKSALIIWPAHLLAAIILPARSRSKRKQNKYLAGKNKRPISYPTKIKERSDLAEAERRKKNNAGQYFFFLFPFASGRLIFLRHIFLAAQNKRRRNKRQRKYCR